MWHCSSDKGMQLGHVIGHYLDGRNRVGKIPSSLWRRHILGGRKAVPNACILPSESRRDTTCRRCAHLSGGVGLCAGINGVLNRFRTIVPYGSGVAGIHWCSQRWVSGIIGVYWAVTGISEQT